MKPARAQAGFTLIEVLVVIVITGIIGGIVAVFLKWPVQNYIDSAGRAELTDIADTAIRRMAREIRLAVPNTVRVSGTALEFMPSKAGGRYLAAEDGAAGLVLDFVNAANLSFTVVGGLPVGRQAILPGDYIVVNNLGPGFAPADVYDSAGQNRAVVASTSLTASSVTLASNPFEGQNPSMAHPMHRFVVAGQPVTFRCSGGVLYRLANYGFNAAQVENPPSASSAKLASNVSSCAFSYTDVGNTRSALIGLSITLERPTGSDGPITLFQQIHVDNTP